MSRYLTIPAAIIYADPITGSTEKTAVNPNGGTECTFAKSCRLVLAVAAQKNVYDLLELLDLRRKLDENSEPGKVLELTDAEHKILETEFRKPNAQVMGVDWVFAGREHIEAVVYAKTAPPGTKQLQ